MKILIVKTSSLGDVVHMLPAITDAVRMMPDLTVDWVVEESFRAVPAWHPVVNQVITIAIRRWRKKLFSTETLRQIRASRRLIRSMEYDAIIDSQGLFKSSVITHWGKGKRYGYNTKSAREPLANWAYDQRFSVSKDLHAIERNRQITAQALGYSLEDLSLDYGLENLINHGKKAAQMTVNLPEKYIVALHGTSRPDKEWPEENWQQLAKILGEKNLPLILPWGNQREYDRAKRITDSNNAIILPKLDLDKLAQIIGKSQAVIGMDTGLMHIAAALGKPGVAIYPATRAKLTGVISMAKQQAIINLEGKISPKNVIEHLTKMLILS